MLFLRPVWAGMVLGTSVLGASLEDGHRITARNCLLSEGWGHYLLSVWFCGSCWEPGAILTLVLFSVTCFTLWTFVEASRCPWHLEFHHRESWAICHLLCIFQSGDWYPSVLFFFFFFKSSACKRSLPTLLSLWVKDWNFLFALSGIPLRQKVLFSFSWCFVDFIIWSLCSDYCHTGNRAAERDQGLYQLVLGPSPHPFSLPTFPLLGLVSSRLEFFQRTRLQSHTGRGEAAGGLLDCCRKERDWGWGVLVGDITVFSGVLSLAERSSQLMVVTRKNINNNKNFSLLPKNNLKWWFVFKENLGIRNGSLPLGILLLGMLWADLGP